MNDVRKMTNALLLDRLTDFAGTEEGDELLRRLRIMEELCEGPKPHGHLLSCICARCERHNKALDAYRAMKEHQNAGD